MGYTPRHPALVSPPDGRGGSMGDAGDGTRWMTYAELAAARRITRSSATRLAFRRGWPRKTGNDGQARVAVPTVAQAPPPDATPDDIPGATPVIVDVITPVATHDNGGGEALTRERQRADHAEVRADQAEVEATAARDDAAAARVLADQRAADLTAALVRAATAEGEAKGLREALTEARRPAWRRWLGL